MNSRWANNLRKRMADHEEPSPDGLWDNIEQIIKERKTARHRGKRMILIRRITTSIAAAILFLLIGYHVIDNTQLDTHFVVEPPKEQNDLKADIVTEKSDNKIEYIENKDYSHVWKKQKRTNSIIKNTLAEAREIALSTDTSKEDTHGNIENQNAQTDSIKEIKTQRQKQSRSKQEKDETAFFPLPHIIKNTRSNNWDVNVFASNILSNSSNDYDGYGSFGKKISLSEDILDNIVFGDNPLTDILLSNTYEETYTDIKHKQPLTVGALLHYNLDEKWGLETGLTYTILSSDLRSGSNNHFYNSKQTLHYVGVPLRINFNIWKNKRFSIYSTGGGLVEKSVSGKLVTDYIINNKKESSKDKSISISQLQWSLNVAAGGQFNLSDKIGLYVEPGVNYYFKDGSKIETIYKEKPTNFNLQLGFRISLD